MPRDKSDDLEKTLVGDSPGTILGAFKEKLVAAKEQWAREKRRLPEKPSREGAPGRRRLPPGQSVVQKWPVLDLGVHPHIPKDQWQLTVTGAVENPVNWGWDDFMAQPQSDVVSDIHCVTSWSLYDSRWSGVTAPNFLAAVRPKPEVRFVVFHSKDGYTTNVPLDRFSAPDVVLAHAWNGESITREHGGPMRIVIPSLYFWKSAKWVRQISFHAEDRPGFWELRGYHNNGDPWQEECYG
ncbi:MAG: sulfite oxidase-like oxidoreductase [Alphaproteobacteria bacterium]|nr:sulfite oxidase-like oxidoreductase [Alphaproteobacteria bacterium]